MGIIIRTPANWKPYAEAITFLLKNWKYKECRVGISRDGACIGMLAEMTDKTSKWLVAFARTIVPLYPWVYMLKIDDLRRVKSEMPLLNGKPLYKEDDWIEIHPYQAIMLAATEACALAEVVPMEQINEEFWNSHFRVMFPDSVDGVRVGGVGGSEDDAGRSRDREG